MISEPAGREGRLLTKSGRGVSGWHREVFVLVVRTGDNGHSWSDARTDARTLPAVRGAAFRS